MSPGCAGCQPSSARVSVLETGLSAARKPARKPKCSLASLGRDGDHRDVEVPPDHLGDGADRHTLVRDRVQPRSRRCLLQGQAEQVCRIEPVHGGPTAGAVADEARDSLVTGNTDQGREESVIPVAVTRRSKSHNRRTDAERSERQRDLLRGRSGPRPAGPRPGQDQARPVRFPPAPVLARPSRRR